MRVTLVNGEQLPVPPVLGGAVEQIIYETAAGIRDPVLTVISAWSTALESVELQPEGVFHHVDIGAVAARVGGVLGNCARPELAKSGVAERFYYLNGATDRLLQIDPDVIEVHNCPEFLPYMSRQFPDKDLILYMHNEPESRVAWLDGVVGRVRQVIFVSRYLETRFLSQYPAYASSTRVIHNAVDTRLWRPGLRDHPETRRMRSRYGLAPDRTVLYVGRIAPRKGLQWLLQAMALVRLRLPDAKLLVVGNPFFRAVSADAFSSELKRRASALGGGVSFTGHIDHASTPFVYSAADVTVVPSIWNEPFGLVIAESMATGVAVIASRRGGIPEIIDDGVDGLLVARPEEVETLAGHIIDLLQKPERRLAMGAAARAKVLRQFSMRDRLAKLTAFYASLGLNRRRPEAVDCHTEPGPVR